MCSDKATSLMSCLASGRGLSEALHQSTVGTKTDSGKRRNYIVHESEPAPRPAELGQATDYSIANPDFRNCKGRHSSNRNGSESLISANGTSASLIDVWLKSLSLSVSRSILVDMPTQSAARVRSARAFVRPPTACGARALNCTNHFGRQKSLFWAIILAESSAPSCDGHSQA